MKKEIKKLTKEDLNSYKNTYLTVGQLKEFLYKNQLPNDAIVVTQRVEDVYYEQHNWGVYLKEGEHANNAKQWNKDIENGKYLDKEKYPLIVDKDLKMFTEEDIENQKEQYTPVFCCVQYKDDKDVLFLDLHY